VEHIAAGCGARRSAGRVSTGQGDVWVYNVHLPNPTDPANEDVDRGRLAAARAYDQLRRDAELDQLVLDVTGRDAPVIVAGDFNVSDGSRPYRQLPSDWRDAFALSGPGFGHTYPTPEHDHEDEARRWLKVWFPLIRIDYALVTGGLTPSRAWTEQVLESDHLAVLADIEIPSAR
jgi:endonuclease/exonuclease/phosphatase family metal-dependent hydrolase